MPGIANFEESSHCYTHTVNAPHSQGSWYLLKVSLPMPQRQSAYALRRS